MSNHRTRHAGVPAAGQLLYVWAFLTLTLCLPTVLVAQDQSAALAATIRVHGTGEPLQNATVLMDDGAYGAITNARGQVRIRGISPGTYILAVEAMGYRTERMTVEFAPGATVEAEVELLLAPIQLPGVTASVRARERRLSTVGFYDRERDYGHATFLPPGEVEEEADRGARLVDVVRRVRGVRVVVVTEPTRSVYRITSARGYSNLRRPCTAEVYLDGVRHEGADIPLKMVAGIEVYPSAALAPPRFNRGMDCPVIVIWTK